MLLTQPQKYSYTYKVSHNYEIINSGKAATIRDISNPTLLNYYNYFIEQQQKLVGFGLEQGTIDTYYSRHSVMTEFIICKHGKFIYPRDFTIKIVREFAIFLKTVKKHSHDYAMKNLQLLGRVLNLALEEKEIDINPITEFYEFHYEKRYNANYLEPDELNLLIKKEFKNARLQKVKDLFLFSCYTGLSYSDVQNFRASVHVFYLESKPWIILKRKKNAQKIIEDTYVPLLPPASAILKKYGGEQLPVISNAKLNSYLKEVFEILGIETHITTASGRKTFGMILHNEYNVPLETISKMLGHTSIRTTEQWYVKTRMKKVMMDLKDSDTFFTDQWRKTIELNSATYNENENISAEQIQRWFNSPFVSADEKLRIIKLVG